MYRDDKSFIVPVGSVTPKERELFAFIVSMVVMRNRQPSLHVLSLNMRKDGDTIMGMLKNLQKYGLIRYRFNPELQVSIPTGGPALPFSGEVR